MKFAKKMSEHFPKSHSLRAYLHDALPKVDKARTRKIIHASEVTKSPEFCPREWALMDITGFKGNDRYIDTPLSYTFHMGRALERQFREEMIPEIVYGDWVCRACRRDHHNQFKPPHCSFCKQSNIGFNYIEPRFTSAISGISGGVDVLVKIPGTPKLTPVELKTMTTDIWKDLKAPLSEHRTRTNLYLRLMAESDGWLSTMVNTDEAVVLYMVKGYGFKEETLAKDGITDKLTPFKEYRIKRNDSATEAYHQKGVDVTEWRKTKVLPQRICSSAQQTRAKTCSQCALCFSAHKPGTTYEGKLCVR